MAKGYSARGGFTGGSGMNRSLLQGVAVMALAAAAFAVTAIHRKKKNHS